MDLATGTISGVPSEECEEKTYSVTVTNSTGAATADLMFSICPPLLANVRYPAAAPDYAVDEELFLMPQFDGSATSWSVSPSLPEGLSLDQESGVISGCLLEPCDECTYMVTASKEPENISCTVQMNFFVAYYHFAY